MPLTSLSAAGFPLFAGWCCLKGNWEKASKIVLWDIEKNSRSPTAFCCKQRDICWGDRLNSWKTKESLPLRELQSCRQLIKHIDQLAGLVIVRLISAPDGTVSSTEHFFWKCVHMEREYVQHMHFFNHTRVCFKAQPASSTLPCSLSHSRDTFSYMIFAHRPSWKPSHHYWWNLPMSHKL